VVYDDSSAATGSERREYVRVDDIVPLEVTVMDPSLRERVRSREIVSVGTGDIYDPGPLDEEGEQNRIFRYLTMLNAKVDALMNYLILEKEGFSDLPPKTVNLSANGIRFPATDEFNVGDLVEIRLSLPTYPRVALCLYGEVVRIITGGDSVEAAARFVELDDEIREQILRYVFAKQRADLRRRRLGA